jgi:hypothetical protein
MSTLDITSQRKYIVKEGNTRVRRRKMSPYLLSKLPSAPKKFVRCWVCEYEPGSR